LRAVWKRAVMGWRMASGVCVGERRGDGSVSIERRDNDEKIGVNATD
jgi:hypothetical protein